MNYIARIAGEKAMLGHFWPHMLRHSCGYCLADQGTDLRTMHDYLGHRDPKHTAHYTRVGGHRFEGRWRQVLLAGEVEVFGRHECLRTTAWLIEIQ